MVDSGQDERRAEKRTPTKEILLYVPEATKVYRRELEGDLADISSDPTERLASQKAAEINGKIGELEIFNKLVERAAAGAFRVAVNDSRDIYADRGRIMTTRIRLGDPNERISKDPDNPTYQLSFFLGTGGGESRAEAIQGISSRGIGSNHSRTLAADEIIPELVQRPTPDTSISVNGVGLYYESNRLFIIPMGGLSFQHRTGEGFATVHGLHYVGNTPHYASLNKSIPRQAFNAKEQAFPHFSKPNLFARK